MEILNGENEVSEKTMKLGWQTKYNWEKWLAGGNMVGWTQILRLQSNENMKTHFHELWKWQSAPTNKFKAKKSKKKTEHNIYALTWTLISEISLKWFIEINSKMLHIENQHKKDPFYQQNICSMHNHNNILHNQHLCKHWHRP